MNVTELRRSALELGVPVGVLCSTCGRLATGNDTRHFGHPITRLRSTPTAPSEWLTVTQVAAALAVSRMTVYRLVHSGDLAGHRIGKQIRVKVSDLAAYVDSTLMDWEAGA